MKTGSFVRDPQKVILLAPLIFVIHVLEEYSSVVSWVNSVIKQGSISQPVFIVANFIVLFFVILITVMMNRSDSAAPAFVAVFLLSSVMFANGLFHIIASIMLDSNCPGVITSIFLYLPFFTWFVWIVMKKYKIDFQHVLFTILSGSVPMIIHGHFIIFRGTHLLAN